MPALPRPILLIHGFDGTPADWTDDGFTDALVREGGFDPALIRLFYYGHDAAGHYDNRGDIRQIAARLAPNASTRPEDLCSRVDTLRQESLARGGPDRVDIVAHSLGGLVARYYLSRRTPDEFGTVYRGGVARLITLGTPHQGVWLADAARAVRHSFLWRLLRWLERLPFLRMDATAQLQRANDALRWWQRQAQRAFFRDAATADASRLDSPALRQIVPGSDFLRSINAPGAMPADVQYHTLYGDIRFELCLTLLRLPVHRSVTPLGDMIVDVESARTIPNAAAQPWPFPHRQRWTLPLFGGLPTASEPPPIRLPPSYHGHLRRHPGVQTHVVHILRG